MKKNVSIILTLIMIFSIFLQGNAEDIPRINTLTDNVVNYLYETLTNPTVGTIGGEWAVLGIARSEKDVRNNFFENYYASVEMYVTDCAGVLHDKKNTEYSRLIVALTAIGKNPESVAGYNLLTPLGDFDKTVWQGINGAIWALIALDSGNYTIAHSPNLKSVATREMYIDYILEKQISDGGWALSGTIADPDVTAMALQALAKYQDNDRVKCATLKALNCLSDMQNENGGFFNNDAENSESSAQVIMALCELGISINDERFIKNGKTILDNLVSFYDAPKGFKHTYDAAVNQMATEQCFCALIALSRSLQNKNSFYRMEDVRMNKDSSENLGLTGKNKDIKIMNIINPDKTFTDIEGYDEKNAILSLAARGIINGKTENQFEPDCNMTRAELATIISRGMGLPQKDNSNFIDVTKDDWFYFFVESAYSYGIVSGISKTKFNPVGSITREEAAVMITRAAELCGINTKMDVAVTRDVLASFADYVKAADWAQGGLTFCYKSGILPNNSLNIKPKETVTRAEIASMLYNMLSLAKLI